MRVPVPVLALRAAPASEGGCEEQQHPRVRCLVGPCSFPAMAWWGAENSSCFCSFVPGSSRWAGFRAPCKSFSLVLSLAPLGCSIAPCFWA